MSKHTIRCVGFEIPNTDRKGYMLTRSDGLVRAVEPIGNKGWMVDGQPVLSLAQAKNDFLNFEKPVKFTPKEHPTFAVVCPACMYAAKLIGGMDSTISELEMAMFDDYGLLDVDGNIDFEYAAKVVRMAEEALDAG